MYMNICVGVCVVLCCVSVCVYWQLDALVYHYGYVTVLLEYFMLTLALVSIT